MPIETEFKIIRLNQSEFHEINEKVMAWAFGIHRELGRSCHERIYQNGLKAACLENDLFTCTAEAEVKVVHGTFSKSYFLDLFVADGVVYETKTVQAFHDNHRKQLLNYLMLLGLHHGTLLNFRPRSMEHEFVSTGLTPDKRRQFEIIEHDWKPKDKRSLELLEIMKELLHDWGAFLDVSLYIEAVTHHVGGSNQVITPIAVKHGNSILGYQNVRLLDAQTAFKITAATKNIQYYKKDLLRFLSHTDLKELQWVNLNHHTIEFRTLSK
ncbi:GxxExxY protein [Pontiella sp.]|uniref:GxxExxY protein n=1 Tax=Pontiella sp. TaxID=2837462 RepID=UPI0035653416